MGVETTLTRRNFCQVCAVALAGLMVCPVKTIASVANKCASPHVFDPHACYGNWVALSNWGESELEWAKKVLMRQINKTFTAFGFSEGVPRQYAAKIRFVEKPSLPSWAAGYAGTVGWMYDPKG